MPCSPTRPPSLILRFPDPLGGGRMHDRVNAAHLFRRRVGGQKLIEGWIEGPCAEAADLRGINTLMLDFYDDPAFVRDLFEFTIEMELRFARAQVQAGIDIMGVGDAAASLVGPEIYTEFVWPYEKKLIDAVHALGVPVRLHICGNTRPILAGMGKLGAEIVDLDYLSPIAEGRAAMGPTQILLGNIEPAGVLRKGTPQQVAAAAERCHAEAGDRFIVSAGCEVPRDTPDANLRPCTMSRLRTFTVRERRRILYLSFRLWPAVSLNRGARSFFIGADMTQADPVQNPDHESFLPQSTVMIVDDNAQNVELLQAFLESLPVKIVTAADGVEALEKVGQFHPDLILLDIMMPRMSGFQVCRKLKSDEKTRDIQILMVTALNELGDIEQATECGTDDFVSKPVNKFELLTRVKSLLRVRHLKSELELALTYLHEVEHEEET